MVFIDLEKAFDKALRDRIRWVLDKKRVLRGYIEIIKRHV